MRVSVRVYSSSRRNVVGGRYGMAEPPVLIVRVSTPAVDGRANLSVVSELASAFGVPTRDVRVVSGATSRHKILDVIGADSAVLTELPLRQ
jgi:uncharacterized protein (TIGR00251 family)